MHADQNRLAEQVAPTSVISEFLVFLLNAQSSLKESLVSARDPTVMQIRGPLEEHYIDDQGKPAMFQRFESAIYDDAREIVTLWQFFESYDVERLRSFQSLVHMEHDGLVGDRHPRKILDRSPFGIAALIVGAITIWMTIVRTFTGEDVSELLELIRFNWIAGAIWVVGLFVVLWYILKMMRNNRQVALLSSIGRALKLYLDERPA